MVDVNVEARGKRVSFVAWFIALYCALVPLENVLTSSLGGSVNKYIGLAVMGLAVLWLIASGRGTIRIYSWAMVAYAVYAFATILWTDFGTTTVILRVMLNAWLFTMVASQIELNEREFHLVLTGMMLAGVILSIVIASAGEMTQTNDVSGGRMTIVIGGLAVDNNNLAVSLSVPALCAFAFALNPKMHKAWRITNIVALAVIVYAILLTGSRGGLLALAGGLLLCLLRSGNGFSWKKILLLVFVLVLLVVATQYLLPESLQERFQVSNVVESGGTGRTGIWISALKVFYKSNFGRMLFGYGFGAFPNMMEANYGVYKASHSDPIQMLLELGIVGFIVYLVMWYQLFKMAFRKKNALLPALLIIIFIGGLSMELLVKKVLWLCFYLVFICPDFEEEKTKER